MSTPVVRMRGWTSRFSSTWAVLLPSINTPELWDREYARGDWERMEANSELGRYALVFAHISKLTRPRVLDVGCGAARLLTMVERIGHEDYVGIDLSTEAIARARARQIPRSSFAVQAAEAYQADRSFDVIVFNELLYYLADPAEVVRRYQAMLAPAGMMVVSMFDCVWAKLVWRKLGRHYHYAHRERVTNHLKHTWDVRVLAPRA